MPRPLLLHLVRHGRTRLNAESRVQGWADSPLTADGLAGIRATAEHLRDAALVAAYASPSGRTVTTAQEILRHHPAVPLLTDPRLRELGFGDFEEQPEAMLAATTDPEVVFRDLFDGTFAGFPRGEPGDVFLSRVARGFTAVEQAQRSGGPVLVVSHGVTLAAYLSLIGAPGRCQLPNASVTTVCIAPEGTRTVLETGTDPSGVAVTGAGPPRRPARVTLEQAAAWHPDSALDVAGR